MQRLRISLLPIRRCEIDCYSQRYLNSSTQVVHEAWHLDQLEVFYLNRALAFHDLVRPLVNKFVCRCDNMANLSVVGYQSDLYTCSRIAVAELCQPHLLMLPDWFIGECDFNRFERQYKVTTVLATDFTHDLVRDWHVLSAHT